MKVATIEIEEKVDELLVCLEADVRHIQESLSNLNELRSLVIKRDDDALGKLLDHIRARADSHDINESNRQSIREELAHSLGCDIEQMTLSRLASSLPQAKREQLIEIQTRLRTLTKELKKEHLSTALLLSECTRLNSLLLRSVFDLDRTEAVYYGPNGVTKRQTDTAFMNLQL